MWIRRGFVFVSIPRLPHGQSASIVPDLSSDRLKNKGGSTTLFPFPSLNINTTVDSIMRDHGMERDRQRRSESRTDGSAASCSQAEKRPLNNNILINASLALWLLAQTDEETIEGWREEQQRLLLARAEPPFTVCLLRGRFGGF